MRDVYFFLPDYPDTYTGGMLYLRKNYEYATKHSHGIHKFGEFRFVKLSRKSSILKLLVGFYYILKIPRSSIIIATNTEYIYFLLPKIIFGFWKKHFYYMIICHLMSKEKNKYLRNFIEHKYIKRADYITTISEATQITLYESKLIEKDVDIIPPGINYKAIESLPEKDDSIFKLLYVGTIEERKGLIYLIDVLNNVVNKNFTLNIVGKILNQDYYELLTKKIKEYKLENKINFLGRVTDEILKELYKKSHLFVFLSIWEGYGMVVAEAASFGLPVIASRLPSLEPLIEEGYNGFFVEINEIDEIAKKIDLLIENKKLWKEISLNALKKASGFISWDEVCLIQLNIINRFRDTKSSKRR
jgi:glycosyltransferase involved in cell wall biosynthesis